MNLESIYKKIADSGYESDAKSTYKATENKTDVVLLSPQVLEKH